MDGGSSEATLRRGWAFALTAIIAMAAPVNAEGKHPVRSLAEIRHQSVVMQKWDLSCGSAALATLLTYDLGDPVSERAVATTMLHRTDPIKVKTRGGFSLLDLQEYAEARGYKAEGYGQMTFDDLTTMFPAIVPLELVRGDHFVVVRGIQNGEVMLADPGFGNRRLSIAEFNRVWVQKVAFIARRPQ
jgi:uncharacterized protein